LGPDDPSSVGCAQDTNTNVSASAAASTPNLINVFFMFILLVFSETPAGLLPLTPPRLFCLSARGKTPLVS
jgi:hypothetical protein